MLPLDLMAGAASEEMGSSAADITANLIDTIVLNRNDICGKVEVRPQRPAYKEESSGIKDSCDLGIEDAMEGMIGGNFNTFGEHTPNIGG